MLSEERGEEADHTAKLSTAHKNKHVSQDCYNKGKTKTIDNPKYFIYIYDDMRTESKVKNLQVFYNQSILKSLIILRFF